jgi:hypothetical protein
LRYCAGEYDSKDRRSKNTEYDRAPALIRRQAGDGKANDDSIVSSQYQVDHDDLDQCRDSFAGNQVGHYRSLRANSMKSANPDDDVRPNLEFGIGVIAATAHHQRGVPDRSEASRIQRSAGTQRPRQASAILPLESWPIDRMAAGGSECLSEYPSATDL